MVDFKIDFLGEYSNESIAYESVNTGGLDEEDIIIELRKEEKHNRSRSLSLRKRFFVLKRDDFTCCTCGASGHGVKLEVDHTIPVAKDGADALGNLHTLCFKCNRGKRDSI